MRIDGIGNALNSMPVKAKPVGGTGETSFGETIKNAISDVNDLQSGADEIANKLAAGEAVEVHQAMLQMQKASTALQFTLQVRNKIIDAYTEIMRMQV